MYNSQETIFRIKQRAKEQGIAILDLQTKCDLGRNAIAQAAKSQDGMKARNLFAIAEVLDCSVDYLLGRTDNPEVTYNNHALSGDGGVAVAGGNANITISNQQKEDTELLNLIKSLPLKKRVKIISMIYEELEEETK